MSPRKQQSDDFRATLNGGPGMGQMADGSFDIFPASELPQRIAERDSEEAAWQSAMEQSESGWTKSGEEADEDDGEEMDPETLDKMLAEPPKAPDGAES